MVEHTIDKGSQLPVLTEVSVVVVLELGGVALAQAPEELAGHDTEQEERGDLERQTSNHDVDTQVLSAGVGVAGRRGNGTTSSLKNQRDQVTRNKDISVSLGLEAGDLGSIDGDDTAQAKVDGSTEESGSNGEGNEVTIEWMG